MSFQWRSVSHEPTEGGVPQERWGATFTAAPDNQVTSLYLKNCSLRWRYLQDCEYDSDLNTLQAWLFGGNSADSQLGDIWTLDLGLSKWCKLSDNPEQAKAWHQAHMTHTDQVE